MRSAFVCALTLLLVCAAAAQTRPRRPKPRPTAPARQVLPTLEEDQKAIADLQQRDIAANLALNLDELMNLRTDDVVYLVPGRAPLAGADAVRKYYLELRQELANSDILAYEENWQEVRVIGEYAYQWGSIYRRTKPAVGDKETLTKENTVRILARQPEGNWKISRVIWNAAPSN